MPIAGDGAAVADTAAAVTTRLADGLAKINNLRVVTPDAASTSATAASAHPTQADFVLTGELQGVLRSLRKSGINVVAIHHHMTMEEPRYIFLHYWGRGPALRLAEALHGALTTIETK